MELSTHQILQILHQGNLGLLTDQNILQTTNMLHHPENTFLLQMLEDKMCLLDHHQFLDHHLPPLEDLEDIVLPDLAEIYKDTDLRIEIIKIDIHLGDKATDLRIEAIRTTHLVLMTTKVIEGVHHQLLTVQVLENLGEGDLREILGQIHQKTE